MSFARLLSLEKRSPLAGKDMIQKLMAYSNGLTGKITLLLAQSTELAIRHRTESISVELLEQAAASGIYKLPAEGGTEEV